ncbi:hypothetical protein ACHAL6_12070 [Proteiniclasticum sp. C24MP]|uniref:anti-sigma-I factor RsgI family protein n=1 Tax=Proteiniclasticum sp. C24MP TaxID=3374101 RepID=UPI0037546128
MKATVVEIQNKTAVLLQEDGIFVKMHSGLYKVGDVVNMSEVKTVRRERRRLGSMAAAAAVALLMGSGVYVYADPSYYVSVDVNPGINLEVNRFDRVIGVEAANEDGEEVLEGISLKNRNVEEALTQTVNRISELGYFEEEGGEVLISTISEDEEAAEAAAQNLDQAVEEEMEENGIEAEVTSKIVGYEMVQAAKEIEGMTPGKYNIIVNLLGIAPEYAKDYAQISIKEIMKEIKAGRDAEEPENEEETEPVDQEETMEETSENQEEESWDQEEKRAEKAEDKVQKESEKAERKELKEAEKAERKDSAKKDLENDEESIEEKEEKETADAENRIQNQGDLSGSEENEQEKTPDMPEEAQREVPGQSGSKGKGGR